MSCILALCFLVATQAEPMPQGSQPAVTDDDDDAAAPALPTVEHTSVIASEPEEQVEEVIDETIPSTAPTIWTSEVVAGLIGGLIGAGGSFIGTWITMRGHRTEQKLEREHAYRQHEWQTRLELYADVVRQLEVVYSTALDHIALLSSRPEEKHQPDDLRRALLELETACGPVLLLGDENVLLALSKFKTQTLNFLVKEVPANCDSILETLFRAKASLAGKLRADLGNAMNDKHLRTRLEESGVAISNAAENFDAGAPS